MFLCKSIKKKIIVFYISQKHGKRPYKDQLHSHGVPFIPVSEIQVLKKTSSGPISGSVFEAIWNKPSGERVEFESAMMIISQISL